MRKRGRGSLVNLAISVISVATIVAAYFVTRDNHDMMREDMEMRNRPILSLEDWYIDIGRGSYGKDIIKFNWEIKNFGQTPATNVIFEITLLNNNNKEIYDRVVFRNKYLVPSQTISNESEYVASKQEVPSYLRLYDRFKEDELKMKIVLRYHSMRQKNLTYIYEISGRKLEDGWRTNSESRDEYKRIKKERIEIAMPSLAAYGKVSGYAFNAAAFMQKFHSYLGDLFCGNMFGKIFLYL